MIWSYSYNGLGRHRKPPISRSAAQSSVINGRRVLRIPDEPSASLLLLALPFACVAADYAGGRGRAAGTEPFGIRGGFQQDVMEAAARVSRQYWRLRSSISLRNNEGSDRPRRLSRRRRLTARRRQCARDARATYNKSWA